MAAAWSLSKDMWKTERDAKHSVIWWNKIQNVSADMMFCFCWNWAELINPLTASIPRSAMVQLQTWPGRTEKLCQRSRGTMQGSRQADHEDSIFLSAKGLTAGPTHFSSNRTQRCCQVDDGVASQQECESPSATSKPRFDSQRESVEWIEDWAVSAKPAANTASWCRCFQEELLWQTQWKSSPNSTLWSVLASVGSLFLLAGFFNKSVLKWMY